MDGTSTDATYVVDPAVGASTALSGTPERARHTPTWTATPTLRSGVSQSPTSPSSNGDSSTHHRVRPKFTINPRLWGSSTSSKVSKAMKLRSVANPHWTDALCQPDFKLPSRSLVQSSLSTPDPSERSLSEPSRNDDTEVDRSQPSKASPARSSQNETEVDRLQESHPNLPHAAVHHDQRDSPLPRRVLNKVKDRFAKAFTPSDRQASLQPQQRFNTAQSAQREVMFSANGHSSQSSLQPHQGFNISQSAQQEGMSSAEGQGPVESDNNIKSVTAWHLIDIRSNFPPDLTGRVVREGQEPFSSGSFGDIFRGTLRMGGRSIYVAVKAIRTYTDDDGDDAKRGQRFRREITTWLKLDHNNVLPLFGTTMNFGRFPAMVCPWLENGSLTSYLERPDRNITTPARLFLVSGVAAGLQYLHSQSVVHGDLSGSNVLVDGNGRACISDFGLSTLLTQLGRSTFATSHQHLGTLRWTAPELLELSEPDGEDELPQIIPSPRCDVYSFGRIMLQILTGKVPFHYWTREAQVMNAISRGTIPQRPRQELVSDRQWSFVQRCWNPIDAGELRPCVEEIVEFVREELVNIAKA